MKSDLSDLNMNEFNRISCLPNTKRQCLNQSENEIMKLQHSLESSPPLLTRIGIHRKIFELPCVNSDYTHYFDVCQQIMYDLFLKDPTEEQAYFIKEGIKKKVRYVEGERSSDTES